MLLSALWQRTWGSYQVVTGILRNLLICIKESSLLSSFELELGIALKALQGKRTSSCTEGGISWFISSCGGKLGVPL